MRKLWWLLCLIGLSGVAYVGAKRLMASEQVGFAAPPPAGPTNMSPAYTAPVPPSAEAPAPAPVGDDDLEGGTEPPPGSYGAGSASPLQDGASPHPSYTIKGNANSMKYHPEDSPYFRRTIAEVWFKDAESAEAAGFRHWRERPGEQPA